MTRWKAVIAVLLITVSFGMFKQVKTAAVSMDALTAFHAMPRLEEGGGRFELEAPPEPSPAQRVLAWALTLVAAMLSLAAGYRICGFFLGPAGNDLFLRIFLSPGAGFAFTVFCLSLNLFIFGGFSVAALVTLHALVAFFPARRPRASVSVSRRAITVYAALIASSIFLAAAKFFKSPFGSGVDVWAIWHYKARLIFRDAAQWRSIFSPGADFSHQDYPLFYPLAVVWGWLVSGWETIYPSWLLSFLFTVSTAGLLFAVWARKRLWVAAAAAFLLLSTPHFVGMGTSQYADVFVAYFNLAVAILLAQSFAEQEPRAALGAGFFAGAGLYMKNEGMLFFLALLVSLGLAWLLAGKQRSFYAKAAALCMMGALPMGMLMLYFKWLAASSNDVVTWHSLMSVADLPRVAERTGVIVSAWLCEIFEENSWGYAWFFFVAALAASSRYAFRRQNAWLWCLILLLNAGYFTVYLITPHEIGHHLEHSLDRVMIHGYPLMIYAVFEAWRA